MSRLIVYAEDDPKTPLFDFTEEASIKAALGAIGVAFERWSAGVDLPADAKDADVLEAYAEDIARLKDEGGYQAVDVARVKPDHPDRAALRGKFLSEHRHDEDEVRFFVEGAGLFYLREAGRVHLAVCEAGDLISVPAGIRHWFDMGPNPRFTAIRMFISPEGWVGRFTGDAIAEAFPRFEPPIA